MPNTRADLDRLRHHWEHDHGAWDPEDGDEMIALCERLLREREDSAQEVRYCHGMQAKADDLAAGLLLEIGRLRDGIGDAISAAHVIRENVKGDLVQLSKVVHVSSLDALLNPEGSTDHAE